MRKSLAAGGLLGALALGPLAAAPAFAAPSHAAPGATSTVTVVAVDDEPLDNDGTDDTGKYGLIGLSGLLGLFGYRKYREVQARRTPPPTTGRTVTDTGTDGTDTGGSRRVQ